MKGRGGIGNLRQFALKNPNVMKLVQLFPQPERRSGGNPGGMELRIQMVISDFGRVIIGILARNARIFQTPAGTDIFVRRQGGGTVATGKASNQQMDSSSIQSISRTAATIASFGILGIGNAPTQIPSALRRMLGCEFSNTVRNDIHVISTDVKPIKVHQMILVDIKPHGLDLVPHVAIGFGAKMGDIVGTQ
jgi:hypothetical protein